MTSSIILYVHPERWGEDEAILKKTHVSKRGWFNHLGPGNMFQMGSVNSTTNR